MHNNLTKKYKLDGIKDLVYSIFVNNLGVIFMESKYRIFIHKTK